MLIALGHQLVVHHHHHNFEIAHHDDDNDHDHDSNHDGHNIFSFGQMDHSYVHEQSHYTISLPLCFYLTTYLFETKIKAVETIYPIAEDHPPSESPPLDRYLLRGPPVC